MKTRYIQYFVEGEDERELINVLKTDLRAIRPGKVQILNVVEQEFTNGRLMPLRPGTMAVLVFDTDTGHIDILKANLEKLKKCSAVSEIVTIPQVANLEQELVRSCNIKTITELLGSRSKGDFKRDINKVTNLTQKLRKHHFDIRQFWCKQPAAPYQDIENQAKRVKLI